MEEAPYLRSIRCGTYHHHQQQQQQCHHRQRQHSTSNSPLKLPACLPTYLPRSSSLTRTICYATHYRTSHDGLRAPTFPSLQIGNSRDSQGMMSMPTPSPPKKTQRFSEVKANLNGPACPDTLVFVIGSLFGYYITTACVSWSLELSEIVCTCGQVVSRPVASLAALLDVFSLSCRGFGCARFKVVCSTWVEAYMVM